MSNPGNTFKQALIGVIKSWKIENLNIYSEAYEKHFDNSAANSSLFIKFALLTLI